MSRTINRVELLGRVGTEPELRKTQNGTAVVQLRLATDRRNGNEDSHADWHTVVCWDKQAEAVAQYVQKGERVYVAGRLNHHAWEIDQGERRSRTEVHAHEVIFLGSSNGNGEPRSENGREDSPF